MVYPKCIPASFSENKSNECTTLRAIAQDRLMPRQCGRANSKAGIVDHALSFESLVIHGDDGIEETLDVAPPIHQTSTFIAATAEDFARQATDPRPDAYYTRAGNPTH